MNYSSSVLVPSTRSTISFIVDCFDFFVYISHFAIHTLIPMMPYFVLAVV